MMIDKVCLVTGATSGLGLVTARELARLGATVVIASRNPDRCARAAAHIRQETGNTRVDTIAADLSSLAQVRQAAAAFLNRYSRLDVLVNNVGAYYLRRNTSADGFELTWALNHLCPFLLTNLLLETMQASAPARIINVSSGAHWGGRINFDRLHGPGWDFGWRTYSQSKLANILFTYELARRLEGSGVTANALHPGYVATQFAMNNGALVRLFIRLSQIVAISPEQGARTILYLASSPEVAGITGKYFYQERETPSSPLSYDQDLARRLWQVSAEKTGLAGGSPSGVGQLEQPDIPVAG